MKLTLEAFERALQFQRPKGQVIDLSGIDLDKLDKLFLGEDCRMKLLSFEEYRPLSLLEIRAWAAVRARYGFPTTELVDWLKKQIKGRTALEIGAGYGDLGYHLGIPMTDSYQQITDPETVAYLRLSGVQPTIPPSDVAKEDAESAVGRRKPQVVIACWVTEWWDPRNPASHGNLRGVRYEYVIERCKTFILIGNQTVHGQSKAMRLPHETHSFPWLVSRAQMQDLNRIWIWKGGRK
jgi:hypothetical protein